MTRQEILDRADALSSAIDPDSYLYGCACPNEDDCLIHHRDEVLREARDIIRQLATLLDETQQKIPLGDRLRGL